MTFNQYINSKKYDIIRLKRRKLNDVNVISLIMVETYYRKPIFRCCEYIYWILTGDKEVSIGLSQMKSKYIKTFQNLNLLQRIKYIVALESYNENYFIVEQYLRKKIGSSADDELICKCYNGLNVNTHYIECFKSAKLYIDSI